MPDVVPCFVCRKHAELYGKALFTIDSIDNHRHFFPLHHQYPPRPECAPDKHEGDFYTRASGDVIDDCGLNLYHHRPCDEHGWLVVRCDGSHVHL